MKTIDNTTIATAAEQKTLVCKHRKWEMTTEKRFEEDKENVALARGKHVNVCLNC